MRKAKARVASAQMKCDYCGKEIGKDDTYGVLGSGLITHEECSREAFTSKTWKARKFRLKNNILYRWGVFKFFIWYVFFMKVKK